MWLACRASKEAVLRNMSAMNRITNFAWKTTTTGLVALTLYTGVVVAGQTKRMVERSQADGQDDAAPAPATGGQGSGASGAPVSASQSS